MSRPSWDTYFLEMCRLVATRSTCLRAQHGAVLVRGTRVIATGYNGSVSGLPHCNERKEGCERERLGAKPGERYELCVSLHAEHNAVLQCAKAGIPTTGTTLYVTALPCLMCARMALTVGVERVIFPATSERYIKPYAYPLWETHRDKEKVILLP